MEISQKKSYATTIVNGAFLIILNLSLISVIGYLTLDSAANLNSRLGALLLSFFLPAFIVTKTKNMNGLERMLKFGFGVIAYAILSVAFVGFPQAFVAWLIPCLVLGLGVFFYGDKI
jgi:hypothetical protein